MPVITLDTLDWVVICLGFLAAFWAGHKTVRQRTGHVADSAMDYMLAGRSLTAPLFAASLIATWYGAVLGAGEFVARYGVVMILCFGVPYYVIAALYAVFLAKRIRRSDAVSIPDQIRRTYGERAGLIATLLVLVIAIPAPYMLTLGVIIHAITQIDLPVSILIGSVGALAIVARGGLRSDVQANVVQVVLMYAGFVTLVVGCIVAFGDPGVMWSALPADHRMPAGSLGWGVVAAWFLIALQTVIDPNFHIRAAAATSGKAARAGLLWSIVGWIIFDGLQLMAGLYAVAYTHVADPSQTFLVAAEVALPAVWKGLFVAAVIAAVMSTLDGYALVSATSIGHDLIDRLRGGGHRRSSLLIGLAITGVVGTLVAISVPSIVDLIYYAASIAVPSLLLPLVWSLRGPRQHHTRSSRSTGMQSAERWMVIPAVIAVLTLVAQMLDLTTIEPMFTGLGASVLLAPFTIRKQKAERR